ncbi:MAG: protein translocase subunit SecF [Actinomycetota bacterium]|jgi:preprotein translocase subunit SecF|nr:protein translocase subunit SecF [Actinomycetota bacterium]
MSETTPTPGSAPAGDSGFNRLFTGRSRVDFIGRSRTFLISTLVLLAVCVAALLIRGLNFSIDFTGGTAYTVTQATRDFTTEELRDGLSEAGVDGAIVQVVDGGQGALVSTPAVEEIGGEEQSRVLGALAETTGAARDSIDVSAVGPRWGEQITRQSLRGLVVFLVLVVAYITLRFELRMAVAALVTLLHDIAVTVGIYALVGFEVSPASVIAFLTILGYSLYDTVVVFDRVREDTATLSSVSTATYGETANRALNEVLVRSLSTSMTSILPVASLLFIGSTLLGAETLKDLALALLVGMAIGTFSSIVVATPFLVWLKEREPRWAELKQRVESRRRSAVDASTTDEAAAVASTTAARPSARKPKSGKSRAARRR